MKTHKGFLLALVLGFAALAQAHHSTANFDQAKEQSITGTVTYFGFTNPHSFVDMEATNPETGKVEAYKVFCPGRVLLARYDWQVADLKAGDKVTIVGYPDRKDPHFMYLARVTFASGKVWQRNQQIPD